MNMMVRVCCWSAIWVASVCAQTVRLRDPANPTLLVSAVSNTTPVQLTFSSTHALSVGDFLHCIGFTGLVTANGALKVGSVISSTVVGITTTADVNIAPTGATDADIDVRVSGNQYARCGKTTAYSLGTQPLGWFSGSHAEYKDPDGAGGSVAPAVTRDPEVWAYLVSGNDAASTAGCDGATAGACTVEEAKIVAKADQVFEGWLALNLAMGWYADNSKTRWKNGALYYIKNMHRINPDQQAFACDEPTDHCARSEEGGNIAFFTGYWSQAYALMRSELTAGERTSYTQKVVNDNTTPCTNQLPLPTMGVNAAPSSGTLTASVAGAFSGYAVNDWVYVRDVSRNYRISDSSLVSIVVSGGIATATVASGYPVPGSTGNAAQIVISGATEATLNGWWATNTGQVSPTFTFTAAGVPNGTYNNAGLSVFIPDNSSWADGVFHQITGVTDSSTITVTPALSASVRYVNAPFAKISAWTSSTCGAVWVAQHHANAPPIPGTRGVYVSSTTGPTVTSLVISAASFGVLAGLATPYYLSVGNETMQVTAVNAATRTLTVTRGALGSARVSSIGTTTELTYLPNGPVGAYLSTGALRNVGGYYQNLKHRITAGLLWSLAPILEDSSRGREMFEYYWNFYVDDIYYKNAQAWSPFPPAGTVNSAYYFGSWADMAALTGLIGKHSFNAPIDIYSSTRWPGLSRAFEGSIRVTRTDLSSKAHLSWGDSGSTRFYESDDVKGFWISAYLWPELAPQLQYFAGTTLGYLNRELSAIRLAYATGTPASFSSWPKNALLRTSSSSSPHPFMLGGLTFRNTWADSATGTVGVALMLTGDDHNASYPCPGALLLAKGPAELLGGSSNGHALFGDLRFLNCVEVYSTTSGVSGGMLSPASYTATNGPAWIDRGKVGNDYSYARFKDQRRNTSLSVTSAHRDVLYLDAGGQDYVLTHDRVTTSTARNIVYRAPFYNYKNDGSGVQSPAATFSRSTCNVTHTSNQYSVRIQTQLLQPATGCTDDATTYSSRLVNAQNGTDVDFVALHQPCPNTSCSAATATLLSSSISHRVVQIDNGSAVWFAAFAKDQAWAGTSFTFTASSFSGTGTFIMTGLVPNTTWTVSRDGSPIASDQQVDAEGVLRFTSAFGAGGFSLSSTGIVPVEVLTTSLPNCTIGIAGYSQQLSAVGGTGPYTWEITTGALPTGLSLSWSGLISGTCSGGAGTSNFTVRATDALAATDTQALSITRISPGPPIVTTSSLPNGTVSVAYSQTLSATGGAPAYSWSLLSGSLPAGLSLSSGGVISGTPSGNETQTFTVRVTDSQPLTGDATLTLIVGTPVTPTPVLISPHVLIHEVPLGAPFFYQFTCTGGTPGYTWSMPQGALPSGLTRTTDTVSGTAAELGDFPVRIRCTDSAAVVDDLDTIFRVETAATAIAIHGLLTPTAAVMRISRSGIHVSDTCSVMLRDITGTPVLGPLPVTGTATRTLVLDSSLPEQLKISATCGGVAGASLLVRRSSPGGTVVSWVGSHATAANALVEWGTDGSVFPNSVVATCQSQICSTTITGATYGAPLYIRHSWRTAGGSVIATGQPEVILP